MILNYSHFGIVIGLPACGGQTDRQTRSHVIFRARTLRRAGKNYVTLTPSYHPMFNDCDIYRA